MRKAIVLVASLFVLSLAACTTTPELKDAETQEQKNEVASVREEDAKQPTEEPVATPVATATPEPTEPPMQKISPDDTALSLLNDTLGNKTYLASRGYQTNVIFQTNESFTETVQIYVYDSLGKIYRCTYIDDRKSKEIPQAREWIEPKNDGFMFYECDFDEMCTVSSVEENVLDYGKRLKKIPYQQFEYYEVIRENGAILDSRMTVKDVEEKFNFVFEALVTFAGGDKSVIEDFPVLVKFYFDENRNLEQITIAVLTKEIEDAAFANVKDCCLTIWLRKDEERGVLTIPYQLFEN